MKIKLKNKLKTKEDQRKPKRPILNNLPLTLSMVGKFNKYMYNKRFILQCIIKSHSRHGHVVFSWIFRKIYSGY